MYSYSISAFTVNNNNNESIHKYKLYHLFRWDSSTYAAIKQNIYGSGLFNFGSYVSLPTLLAYFLSFDVPTSLIFIENVFLLFMSLLELRVVLYDTNVAKLGKMRVAEMSLNRNFAKLSKLCYMCV